MTDLVLALSIVLAALVGVYAGGLINLLADDLPYVLRIRRPHYANDAPRPFLGLVSFLRGQRLPKASSPDTPKLSWRHPITELVTAALFAYIASIVGVSGQALFLMGSVVILILITVIDLEHRMILYVVMLPAYVYAIVGVALVGPAISERISFRDYLIGGGVGFGLFLLMYLGGIGFNMLLTSARGEKPEEIAFGYGDVMLATLSGLLLGWQALIFAVTIAVFAGGAGALFFLGFRLLIRRQYEMFTALPYGQYIVFGTIVMLLWRAPVINFLQRLN